MRKLSLVALLVVLCAGQVQAGNYLLRIDGKEYELDLGVKTNVTFADGRVVSVELAKSAIAEFRADSFSFNYPHHVTPGSSDLGNGKHQTALMTPSGTMILIQEYAGTDPASLVDLMLDQLIREEAKYGYKISKTAAAKKLADGKTLTGKRAISRYQTEEYDRYVLSYGNSVSGVLIITQRGEDMPDEDQAMIDLFWKSFRIMIK